MPLSASARAVAFASRPTARRRRSMSIGMRQERYHFLWRLSVVATYCDTPQDILRRRDPCGSLYSDQSAKPRFGGVVITFMSEGEGQHGSQKVHHHVRGRRSSSRPHKRAAELGPTRGAG